MTRLADQTCPVQSLKLVSKIGFVLLALRADKAVEHVRTVPLWDDDDQRMPNGSLVPVNGKHERTFHFEGSEICIHDWPEDEMIFSIAKVEYDLHRNDWPEVI